MMGKIKFCVSRKVQAGEDMRSLRDYGDFAKMVVTVPSCNTDQGVYPICECAGGETHTRNESEKCVAQAAALTDLVRKV